jgi:hypothetical protein
VRARDAQPDFWGWDDLFAPSEDASVYRRYGVRFRIGSELVDVNMMTWPVRHEFRLRSEVLRSSGDIDDILRIERAREGADYNYYAEVVPRGTTLYPTYLALCVNHAAGASNKVWGYY